MPADSSTCAGPPRRPKPAFAPAAAQHYPNWAPVWGAYGQPVQAGRYGSALPASSVLPYALIPARTPAPAGSLELLAGPVSLLLPDSLLAKLPAWAAAQAASLHTSSYGAAVDKAKLSQLLRDLLFAASGHAEQSELQAAVEAVETLRP